MKWRPQRILSELKKLHRAGANLSYNNLARSKEALLSAAAYHFGSYRRAIERAGIEYQAVLRRPRWNKRGIIALIKQARRREDDLNWGTVIKRGDELARAAFASLQPRLFGSWARALHAAGLDADECSPYRSWDRDSICFELRELAQDDEPVNSGALQQEDPGLYAAAVRYFGSYDAALRAARLDPREHRLRRKRKS